jgi:flagellar hook-basal body complex protein FliE
MKIQPTFHRLKVGDSSKLTQKESIDMPFSEFLKNELWTTPREQMSQAENLVEQAATNPGINKLQLVVALTEAEIELQKTTAVFTKAQEAYDKILHMPL